MAPVRQMQLRGRWWRLMGAARIHVLVDVLIHPGFLRPFAGAFVGPSRLGGHQVAIGRPMLARGIWQQTVIPAKQPNSDIIRIFLEIIVWEGSVRILYGFKKDSERILPGFWEAS